MPARAYISGLPSWGTLIALVVDGEPLIGLIDQPYLQERYLGFPGGATLNGATIVTRACRSLSLATLSTTDPGLFVGNEKHQFAALLDRCRLVRYGLDCYAYAVLAAGFIDIVAESGLQAYDMMALVPIVRGAGGLATSWTNQAPGREGTLLATGDPELAGEALQLLATAY